MGLVWIQHHLPHRVLAMTTARVQTVKVGAKMGSAIVPQVGVVSK